MKFLADMNISLKTVAALRKQGWNIVRVSEILAPDASDQEILEFARREGRTVITQDLDFSALLALGGHSSPSLLTLRLARSDPETVTRRLLQVVPAVKDELQRGAVVTVEEVAVRVRQLPISYER